jgi:hypothetical protein
VSTAGLQAVGLTRKTSWERQFSGDSGYSSAKEASSAVWSSPLRADAADNGSASHSLFAKRCDRRALEGRREGDEGEV